MDNEITEEEANSKVEALLRKQNRDLIINIALNKTFDEDEEGADDDTLDSTAGSTVMLAVKEDLEEEEEYIYKTTIYRWFILISYSFVLMASGFS